jgi:hypothetical protein
MSAGTSGGALNDAYRRETLPTTVVVVVVVDVVVGKDVVVVVDVVVCVTVTPPGPVPFPPTPDGPEGLLFSQATITVAATRIEKSSLRI